ncbi:MAG: DEAD/DEAH box helicase [Propionibacteriaceae bacterium]|nr:DEAD/DEAH box helicase [Propionibacteriaceae bacterium]
MPETTPDSGFAGLGLDERLLRTVRELGYEDPTGIQSATIPLLLAGRDVVGLAQTGTGKTAAFALPILQRLNPKAKTPQALVLAPTRELALQVCEAFESYAAHLGGVHVLPVYGGQGYGVQLSALARGVQVVVGTPGRIIDHLDRGTLDLDKLRFVVLDEADEMLNMGFAEDVESILSRTPAGRQVALFSATMPPQIRKLAKGYLDDPAEVVVAGKTRTAPNVTHRYLLLGHQQKVEALTRLLEIENFEAMIVFVRTKNETETLAEKLRARGFSAAAISGDIVQAQRERTIGQLRDGKLDILVATDVAARGLDVDRVSHVVNFDIPTDVESYVHRVGRTGRAGRSGDAISLVTPRERRLLVAIERSTGQRLSQVQMPSAEDVNATRLTRFDDEITAALASDRLDFFRDVISHYVTEFDVPEVDVAAALALQLQGAEPLLLEPDAAVEPERSGSSRGRNDLVPYRLAVGKQDRVLPRQIVGALANEGGLRREDFGRITIRPTFSLVELPAQIPAQTWAALRSVRIAGRPIDIELDKGPKGSGKPFGKRKGGPGARADGVKHDKRRKS